ncbi:LuxR C-terminal-related transcriptional regulator [Azospirillum halopraeferens]|uniref:LuxR C-terminal-related transcriptional regulator n=1 Tax=Azospirillum halopraeferens TaxID=34010 RepID=UPI0004158607|nr:response regulator transcription factor [Azospirillum halopraeferens]
MRLLIADDHVMVRDGLRPFLLELGKNVDVYEAGTFGEVLEVLSSVSDIRLLLLDMRMPGMDGPAGIRMIRERFPTLPIAVLSSVTDRRTILTTLAQGVSGFIPKRLSAQAMVSALRLIIAGERYVPAALIEEDRASMAENDGPERNLTTREREILDLLREGLSNKLIARRLNVSEVTIKSHLCHVFRKLGVQNRVQAARFAAGM